MEIKRWLLLTLCILTHLYADEIKLDGFVKIPKNPVFSFAKALTERKPGMRQTEAKGEKSSIADD